MEELEKEMDTTCECCPECNCGDDCHCTPDNKCCDECTCDTNCNCHNGDECNCSEQCKCNKEECHCDDNCTCGEHCECTQDNKCGENCTCDEVNDCQDDCQCNNDCACGEDCKCGQDDKCDDECECEIKDSPNDQIVDDEKCQCGCGESVIEENTADAYFKQLLSLRAEFDNYRKRSQGDIAKAYSNGFNQAITEFLPALDSFKMATEYITDPNTLMGIQYIEKGILSTLEKMGIQVIDATGKFDPDFHQAIGSEVSPEHESGDIIKECFKGFKMGDKVIRYAQVIVAK